MVGVLGMEFRRWRTLLLVFQRILGGEGAVDVLTARKEM